MYFAVLVILLHCPSLKAQDSVITINNVELTVPSQKVKNGMSIELTCIVDISKSTSFWMQHAFLFYKDDSLLYNTTSEQDRAHYKIFPARFADSGSYKCSVQANGKIKSSDDLDVQVEGLSQPKLTALKTELKEGEVVTLRCEEPEEKPPFIFVFKKLLPSQLPQVKKKQELKENFASVEFPVEEGDRILRFQCIAQVNSAVGSETSEPSNVTLVTVVEPFSHPKLTSKSPRNVTEGDKIDIVCTTILAREYEIEILIQKDRRILNSARGQNSLTYSTIATVENNGNYTCKVELGRVSKTTSMNIVVEELFAKPILTPSLTDLDENQRLSLWCHINGSPKANFSIVKRPPENGILLKTSSNFTIQAQVNDTGSYVCRAEIKGIIKESNPVQITVYAPVSEPVLSVANSSTEMVLGETLLLRCQSMSGTPPINYTLFRGNRLIHTITVFNNTYAEFRDRQTKLNNLREYRCEASNRHSYAKRSSYKMNITVIAPIRNISFGSLPNGEVEDGGDINFLCIVGEGSLPIDFRIFKQNDQKPLFYESKMETRVVWQKKSLNKQDAGKYFCEASNRARVTVRSNLLTVKVILASWQKGFIALFVLAVIAIAASGFWWYWRKKEKGKHPSMEMSGSTAATNSTSEKLESGQNHHTEFYPGSGYIEDSESPVKSTGENKGPDHESAEVEYTEVEVSTSDPYKAPVKKGTDTVYSEIRKANNDSGENRHSRIEGSPDAT
ncbi:platelet endothelial cell adhesion molecule isoform X1 [Chelonia mydas]|uniref:platelet endothelial cell adhesion molecule isoform X1 n=1 Tax=Chelonia mydas TaxID=8469 RepID=UPI0018A201E7|nr:platelet endothelial cell adhesion molecule isoform X1 [Chelonia mydas]XP_043383712.1 platelet endothelial cell adhesion molecule isoform X1 [Chelonia mydas]XP_043383713.1 platelet endothelial cell adhesion molecule isoform X1 [Chelonia mydas]